MSIKVLDEHRACAYSGAGNGDATPVSSNYRAMPVDPSLVTVATEPTHQLISIKTMKHLSIVTVATLALSLFVYDVTAQDLHPSRRPSPIGIAKTTVGDAYVKVTYGRPYMRGRDIFGANTDEQTFLVPFGEVWRTGANEATEITVTGHVMLGGQHLDAGTYSVFTVPNENEWVIHISPHLGLDGTGIFDPATQSFTPVFDPADNVLTLTVPSSRIEEEVDQFTIEFEDAGGGADMVLRWENTEVRIPVRSM